MRPPSIAIAAGLLAACVGLPPLGAWLAGRSLAPLLRFPPPLEIPADYPRFSWLAAGLVLGAGLLVAGAWIGGSRPPGAGEPPPAAVRRLPWWGWVAAAWTLAWWWLAWTRQAWFAGAQRYTFTPLWVGFVVTVNALAQRRSGTCLAARAPARWLGLFAASAAFWWLFEWLNRFVRNWHYPGAADVGATEYAVHASLCFSTVLPAVAGVQEWLRGWPRLQARLGRGPPWPWLADRRTGALLVAAGAAGLALTGAQPLQCYPALWLAPLLLGVGAATLRGEPGWWREAAHGDWREAGSWALAALLCGGFWECWNFHSLARWVYTVPFVQRWPVFEMPALGYTGYLAFGLECALATGWALGAAAGPRAAGRRR